MSRPLDPRAVCRAAEVLGVAYVAVIQETGVPPAIDFAPDCLTDALQSLAHGRRDTRATMLMRIEQTREWRRDCGPDDADARVSAFVAWVLWCALRGVVLP